MSQKKRTFAPAFKIKHNGDPLAQLVEHNTFNVGVLGSSPKRITKTLVNQKVSIGTKMLTFFRNLLIFRQKCRKISHLLTSARVHKGATGCKIFETYLRPKRYF